jgi:hypothetical protein
LARVQTVASLVVASPAATPRKLTLASADVIGTIKVAKNARAVERNETKFFMREVNLQNVTI